ncbi:alpha/beta hydrolase [Actinomadura fibrosa]|uniref:Alpha/beta hydrolase n=1 Tax=Actinomadura fibrosa TaxID=111802 RepID=A0ABW2XYH1_9ACTN|nr:alpha/beta hydrolase [Actinomadura fibrosa]
MRRLWKGSAAVLSAGTALVLAAGSAPGAVRAAGTAVHYTGTLADGSTWVADVPARWNGRLVLFSHGFGPLVAADRPSEAAGQALLDRGYALAGSSYAPGSLWALGSAVGDQLGTRDALAAIIGRPRLTIALGQSMGGLVSAKIAETGRVDGALNACGIVAGGVDLDNYQLDAGHTVATLLAPGQTIKLTDYANAGEGALAGAQLTQAVKDAQATPAGRARIALAAAFHNLPSWNSGDAPPARHDYAGRQLQQYQWFAAGVLSFTFGARPSINAASGGDSAWNKGLDHARLLRTSANLDEIKALYRDAGLNLHDDLARLDAAASKQVEPGPLAWMTRTSQPTGRLKAPTLSIHTIADQLVPVEQENEYAATVRAAGRSSLLRQAYVRRIGHCNFSASEYVASLQAVEARIKAGHWPSTTAAALNKSASALSLDTPAFVPYKPSRLVVQAPHPGPQ